MATSRATSALRLVAVVAVVALAGGCADPRLRAGVIETQPDGLRTFTLPGDENTLCVAFGLVDPLSGTLRADASGRPEKLWLERDGQRLSVVWPEGFTLRFEPDAVLYDEAGSAVAQEDSAVTLDQVRPTDASGTYDDPYIASGILLGSCYPYARADAG